MIRPHFGHLQGLCRSPTLCCAPLLTVDVSMKSTWAKCRTLLISHSYRWVLRTKLHAEAWAQHLKSTQQETFQHPFSNAASTWTRPLQKQHDWDTTVVALVAQSLSRSASTNINIPLDFPFSWCLLSTSSPLNYCRAGLLNTASVLCCLNLSKHILSQDNKACQALFIQLYYPSTKCFPQQSQQLLRCSPWLHQS